MVFNVAGVAGLLTSLIAALTIWLLLAQPLSVANAVTTRDLPTLARTLAAVIGDAVAGILRYL
jgi:hypothetical protein